LSKNIIFLNVVRVNDETEEPDLSAAQPLGALDHVLNLIVKAFPDIDVSDTAWVILTRAGYSLTFNFNGREPVQSLTIGVHGDRLALDDIKHFCSVTGWAGFDTGTGEYIFP
jgi:hypothetical protein